MKAKCIKADPIGWLEVGKVYECTECSQNIVIEGTGFALSRENFKEMFDKLHEYGTRKNSKTCTRDGVLPRH